MFAIVRLICPFDSLASRWMKIVNENWANREKETRNNQFLYGKILNFDRTWDCNLCAFLSSVLGYLSLRATGWLLTGRSASARNVPCPLPAALALSPYRTWEVSGGFCSFPLVFLSLHVFKEHNFTSVCLTGIFTAMLLTRCQEIQNSHVKKCMAVFWEVWC